MQSWAGQGCWLQSLNQLSVPQLDNSLVSALMIQLKSHRFTKEEILETSCLIINFSTVFFIF